MVNEDDNEMVQPLDFDQLEQDAPEEFRRFVRKVRDEAIEPYEENQHYSSFVAALGVVLVFFGGVYLVSSLLDGAPISMIVLPFICVMIGLTIMITGTVIWMRFANARKFHGIKRSTLSEGLFQLEAYETGAMKSGLGYPPVDADTLIRRLNADTGFFDKELCRKRCEGQRSQFKYYMPALLAFFVLLLFVLNGASETEMLVLGYIVMAVTLVMTLWFIGDHVRLELRLRRVESDEYQLASGGAIRTVSDILALLRREYAFPLKLRTLRIHEDLLYTGREHEHDDDYTEYEALFIPSV